MVSIPLGLGDWESTTQDVSRLKLHNMYVVPNPSTPDGVSRVSRPTLSPFTAIGLGPIIKVWQQPSIFDGDALVISGTELFRLNSIGFSTKVGNIPGSGLVDIAGTQLLGSGGTVMIVRDGIMYRTDGAIVIPITIPDSQPVLSVASLNGYFIFSIKNTQKFYWLRPGLFVVDPLDFASAERIPDPIISVNVVSDELWFLGQTGPEVWTPTGDFNSPWQRVSGRVYKEGCHSRDTVITTAIDGLPALLWVTDTKSVVKAQGAPSKISNESVEEILKTSDDISAWFFRYNRHDFYLINSPVFTLVYDITMGLWSRWDTYGRLYWVAQSGYQQGSRVVVGDGTENKLYTLSEDVADNNTLPVQREISGFLPNSAKPVKCNEIVVYVNSGWGPDYVSTPVLELRWSDDLGATWSDYAQASLGQRGDYSRSVSFRSLGLVRDPGRIFEFRVTDFVRFRLDYVTMNERL
jgi:hypothetical protein